jgi:cytoskeletal protein CcmA (bactofilin family)
MTCLGPTLRINGDITGEEDLTIQCRVTGSVVIREHGVVISHEACLDADVRGSHVVVQGEVNGAVAARDCIELGPLSRVTGSLSAGRIVVADGAYFTGSVDMGQRTISTLLANYRATPRSA